MNMTKKPHVHAATIIEWANGAQIEYRAPDSDKWKPADLPAWIADYSCRVKPVREYPQTAMTVAEANEEWFKLYRRLNSADKDLLDYANIVLRHAIDNGQVVTREEFKRVSDEANKAVRSLNAYGYMDEGGDLWKPPVGIWISRRNG